MRNRECGKEKRSNVVSENLESAVVRIDEDIKSWGFERLRVLEAWKDVKLRG